MLESPSAAAVAAAGSAAAAVAVATAAGEHCYINNERDNEQQYDNGEDLDKRFCKKVRNIAPRRQKPGGRHIIERQKLRFGVNGVIIRECQRAEHVANLFTMMEIVSEKETYDFFNEKYNNCEIRYGDMKKQLAEDINKFCAPIRERILDMAANTEYLDKVARRGAEKARESASKTLNEVRQIIGFRPY